MKALICSVCGLEGARDLEGMPCEACFKGAWRAAYNSGFGPIFEPEDAETARHVVAVAAELDRRDVLRAELEALNLEITAGLAAVAPSWMSSEDAAACVRSVARAELAARWRPQDEPDAPRCAGGGDLEAPRDGESLEAFHARAASSLLDHYLAGGDEDVAAELREILDHIQARAIASLRAELADHARRQDEALAETIAAVAALAHAQRPAMLADALRCAIQALGAPLEALEARAVEKSGP